ncbi:COG3650 family protein [Pseudomonas sp. R5(2019)]|uniref:COG3650 family protein n=1 Tax=Pseudomonas sp. R5(2019) TaxID=2697566 RepID=UPI001412C61B|nr:hypothetical protein [Pseudomonas sp. R5(2019)]NBA94611.1 hypothetical protein [Pseudomonas sp. R5(2019)]
MRAARSLLFVALLPVFAGCQMFAEKPTSVSTAGMTRMQGELKGEGGQLVFQPCSEGRRFVVNDTGNTGIVQEVADLAGKPLFVDLRGSFAASSTGGNDGQLNLHQFYRLERSASACSDPNFKRLTLRASGHKPDWTVKASGKGMVLEREGQPPLALPYLEEQLPEGRFNLTSEANDQRIELWAAPQRCVDSVTGSVQHLSAELRVNGKPQRGCAYYGGSRDD